MTDNRPPLSTTTSLWPAAAVLITGLVMLIAFTLINTLGDQGVSPTATSTTVYVVGGLALDASNSSAHACSANDNPPANVASALMLPIDTTRLSQAVFANLGAGDFDCHMTFHSVAHGSQVLRFYAQQLKAQSWNLFSQGSSTGQPQSLFQKAGSDGFYWVLGITVLKNNDSGSTWTLRIYQNSGQI